MGFHERGSSFVADMSECHTLPPFISDLLLPLRRLTERLSIRERMPQVEVAVGDSEWEGACHPGQDDRPPGRGARGQHPTALVFRVLDPPTDADLAEFCEFAAAHRIEPWLQPKGPETAYLLCDAMGRREAPQSALAYGLAEFGLRIPFLPTEFTQVNFAINRQLLTRAVHILDPRPDDNVVDLFCGLGNFTLPLATRARQRAGNRRRARPGGESPAKCRPEPGGPAWIGRRSGRRRRSGPANLFNFEAPDWAALGRVDKLVIDPPRDGALAVSQALATASNRPSRIVYVSCNPATLARDLGILVNTGGWTAEVRGRDQHVSAYLACRVDRGARVRRNERLEKKGASLRPST